MIVHPTRLQPQEDYCITSQPNICQEWLTRYVLSLHEVSILIIPWSPWCHRRYWQVGSCSPRSSEPLWLSRWPAPGHSAFGGTQRLCWAVPTRSLGASSRSLEGIWCEMSQLTSSIFNISPFLFFNHDSFSCDYMTLNYELPLISAFEKPQISKNLRRP